MARFERHMTRAHSNTVKVKTTFGSIFFHVETDRPCNVVGLSVATPQKLENTALYQFIGQLEYRETVEEIDEHHSNERKRLD